MLLGTMHFMKKPHPAPSRRKHDMVAAEAAYRQGLRRRASDREEVLAYYLMFAVTLGMLLFIGVGSWIAR